MWQYQQNNYLPLRFLHIHKDMAGGSSRGRRGRQSGGVFIRLPGENDAHCMDVNFHCIFKNQISPIYYNMEKDENFKLKHLLSNLRIFEEDCQIKCILKKNAKDNY